MMGNKKLKQVFILKMWQSEKTSKQKKGGKHKIERSEVEVMAQQLRGQLAVNHEGRARVQIPILHLVFYTHL